MPDLQTSGRDDWIRTSDPLTPSQVRYQAAPRPDMSLRLAQRRILYSKRIKDASIILN